VLKNLSGKPRKFEVDLSALGFASTHYRLKSHAGSQTVGPHLTLTLSAQEEAHWTPEN
jgi:hypothetical protein